MLFHREKKTITYDPDLQTPAVRKSICTGEMTAGMIDKKTGQFQELARIDSLEEFKKQVHTEEIRIIY